MKRMNLRKTMSAMVLIGATMMAASAMADQPQGAYGHAMMVAYGQGYGQNQGYGMGARMMGDYGSQFNVNLSAEQRGKIAKTQEDARRKQWELMR